MGTVRTLGFAAGVVAAFLAGMTAAQAVELLVPFLFSLWFLAFFLDAATTREIYRLSPRAFELCETNRVFVALVQRTNISLAFLLFFMVVEIPCLAFISFVIAPALGSFLFGGVSTEACLGASATGLALAHAYAWRESAKTARVLRGRKGDRRC
ncbi:MAG: hypothetical protein H5T49_03235 [Hadesarchaea archaeon]|nr:hypothetical protein [Hadesarchaea archaeon]